MPCARLPLSFIPMLAMLLTLAGCAAPSASGSGAVAAGPPATDPPKVMSSPYPPREVPPAAAVDYACRTHADCAVKDVGNCCGAMPACVNKDSPTDPQAVQAQCAARGMMGVCGFTEITACQCVDNRCTAAPSSTRIPVP